MVGIRLNWLNWFRKLYHCNWQTNAFNIGAQSTNIKCFVEDTFASDQNVHASKKFHRPCLNHLSCALWLSMSLPCYSSAEHIFSAPVHLTPQNPKHEWNQTSSDLLWVRCQQKQQLWVSVRFLLFCSSDNFLRGESEKNKTSLPIVTPRARNVNIVIKF